MGLEIRLGVWRTVEHMAGRVPVGGGVTAVKATASGRQRIIRIFVRELDPNSKEALKLLREVRDNLERSK